MRVGPLPTTTPRSPDYVPRVPDDLPPNLRVPPGVLAYELPDGWRAYAGTEVAAMRRGD